MALTDEHGRFEIRNLPVGSWRFAAWHERTGEIFLLDMTLNRTLEIRPDRTTELDTREIFERDLTESP